MKNADFRGGAICRTRKGATACVEVPSSVPALRVQVSACFALIFWGFQGVFRGFSRVLTVSAVSGASPHKQARRTSYPLRAAFSFPSLGRRPRPYTLFLCRRSGHSHVLAQRPKLARERLIPQEWLNLALSDATAAAVQTLRADAGEWVAPHLFVE